MKILCLNNVLIFAILLFAGCSENGGGDTPPPSTQDFIVNTTSAVNNNFGGNGAQWGGYGFLHGQPFATNNSLSQADWDKLYKRVGFMRPGIVRIMASQGWNYSEQGDPAISEEVVVPVLDFCQKNGYTVAFGEWGHVGGTSLDEVWLDRSLNYLDWLVNTKGYTCIKYFIMVNEPNGNWASTNASYPLWKSIIEKCYLQMEQKGLLSKVKIMGPDIAFWNQSSGTDYKGWITSTAADLSTQIAAYDTHTYPGQKYIRGGTYSITLSDHKREVPLGKDIYIMEMGCKYPDEPDLNAENKKRIGLTPFTDDDSNMLIYDAFYGIDIADAIIQSMNVGYAGNVLWDMDDAMYCGYGSTGGVKLKRWGFWNILGAEGLGGAADENIRPWFYTTSLLCRYFPTGSKIYKVESPDKRLRGVAGIKNGKFTVAIINSTYTKFDELTIKFDTDISADQMKVYQFSARIDKEFIGTVDADGLATPMKVEKNVNLKNGYTMPKIPGLTFTMITNME